MSEFVPEGWRNLTLGESAFNISKKYNSNEGSNPRYVGLEHINSNMELLRRWGHADDVISAKNIFRVGDTLFGKLRPYLKKVSIVDFDGICSTDILVIRAKKEICSEFLYRILSSEGSILHSIESSAGNVMPRTSWKDMAEYQFILPPFPEQQKIAAILTSVDEVIEKTQAQINKLKDLKTGMMQELLTRGVGVDGKPHTEFKDSPVGIIPKGWEVVKLSEVLTKIDSGWSPACIEVPPQIGEWGVLKVSSVTRGEFLEIQSKTLPSNLEPKEHIKVKNGDLLLTRANGVADLVGKCVMIQSEPRSKLMMSDKILRLNPNKHIYSHFLLHAFNSQEMRRQIELSWGGSSGQKNISQADIKNYLLALPSFDEQKSIGDSISQVDRVLSAKNNKLIRMNNIKKALMQDLLTGKVRVKVDS